MKVSFLLISLERSGGVRVTVEIANQLAKLNHDCRLVVCSDDNFPFPVHNNVQIVRARRHNNQGKLSAFTKLFSLAKAVPSDSDVIVASYYLTAYSAVLSRIFARNARLFYVVQGYEPNYFRQENGRSNYVSYLLARLSYFLPLRKTAISHWLSNILASKGHCNVPVINNGIDAEIFTPDDATKTSTEVVIMTIANSRPNRGFYDFCDAISVFRNTRSDFKLLIIGSDRHVAKSLNVPYDFLTPRCDDQLVDAYRSSTIYVTCSHEEGFGLTPLEAMACGTSVVCTDSGGLRDYAQDGINCLMVPVRDISRIANAITRLLDDHDLRNKLATQGRCTALEFSWTVIGKQYETIFNIG